MLNFPSWQRWLVIGLCLIGVVLALPNLFYGRVERANDARAAIAQGQPETPEMAAAMAGWPAWLPSRLVSLGLDLRGGAHVLVEVMAGNRGPQQLSRWSSLAVYQELTQRCAAMNRALDAHSLRKCSR